MQAQLDALGILFSRLGSDCCCATQLARRSHERPPLKVVDAGHPDDVHAGYQALRRSIEGDALTALLLPAFELEACVQIIVQRQLARPYLPGNRTSEERRIRERFPKLMALPCARFQSDAAPDATASQIERFVRRHVGIPE
ncbi:hypothetical protein [Variovorax sp. CF079]|uniref:hypothetical protein n=1 Tax=Variovorax sp. CF079 TaxID=1882774 RepID=UPI0011142AAF|nr:hypothetical protein [Variovorax sp. CF079]